MTIQTKLLAGLLGATMLCGFSMNASAAEWDENGFPIQKSPLLLETQQSGGRSRSGSTANIPILTESRGRSNSAISEIESLKQQINILEGQVEDAPTLLDSLQSQVTKLEEKVSVLETQKSDLQSQLNEAHVAAKAFAQYHVSDRAHPEYTTDFNGSVQDTLLKTHKYLTNPNTKYDTSGTLTNLDTVDDIDDLLSKGSHELHPSGKYLHDVTDKNKATHVITDPDAIKTERDNRVYQQQNKAIFDGLDTYPLSKHAIASNQLKFKVDARGLVFQGKNDSPFYIGQKLEGTKFDPSTDYASFLPKKK